MSSVIVRNVAKYLPKTVKNREEMRTHFASVGAQVDSLFDVGGRENHPYIEDYRKETSVTMATKACEALLEKEGLSLQDVQGFFFVSDAPEYTVPSNAITIVNALGDGNDGAVKFVMDLNQNCTGLLSSFDMVSAYMKTRKDLKRCVLVSVFNSTHISHKEDPATYGFLTDGSSALLLEKIDQGGKGILDSDTLIGSDGWELMSFPSAGYSKVFKEETSLRERTLRWDVGPAGWIPDKYMEVLPGLLERNGLTESDVDYFICSQFHEGLVKRTCELMNSTMDKWLFVSRSYGYAGNASPGFAFEEGLRSGKFTEGKTIVWFSFGAGYTLSALLYRF
ncbi:MULTISPECIES: 3-oxoacyl-ACP synthase III family protein [Shouchella]|uniref:3-oxoacyl-[acyl-carrier-protein] synthase III C-terminal domain-containing protein n=1 Tax=Shouchella hunanensis TaxID=766894 RepID=A0ABY7W0J3_9BACI|nr:MULTISPECIES: 3-oxoacyl-[acyl-carrier-protein] synthase III C-terminal domain-containing protein [Shouchella]WDF02480.1 3-oxoacyl-[acyl-carrier-protein] synthase III C-terminal domain-containing protein [Shouchella hunanensis]GAF24248.1 3-oxoacyl-[acyl-carrier-protein] synthase [Bacillus sp. JCM 19047]